MGPEVEQHEIEYIWREQINGLSLYTDPPLALIPKHYWAYTNNYAYIYLKFTDEVGDVWIYVIGKLTDRKKIGKKEFVEDGVSRPMPFIVYNCFNTTSSSPKVRHTLATHSPVDILGRNVIADPKELHAALDKELEYYRKHKKTRSYEHTMFAVNVSLANQTIH